MADGQNTAGLDLARMNGGTVTMSNCYKTTSAGTYGTHVYTSAPDGEVSKPVTLLDGNTYYAACTIGGVRSQCHGRSLCRRHRWRQ